MSPSATGSGQAGRRQVALGRVVSSVRIFVFESRGQCERRRRLFGRCGNRRNVPGPRGRNRLQVAVGNHFALVAVSHRSQSRREQRGDRLEQVGAAIGLLQVDAEAGRSLPEGDQLVQLDPVHPAQSDRSAALAHGYVEDEGRRLRERLPALDGGLIGDLVGQGQIRGEGDEVTWFIGHNDVGVQPASRAHLHAHLFLGKVRRHFAIGELVVGVAVRHFSNLLKHARTFLPRRFQRGHCRLFASRSTRPHARGAVDLRS